ncbi:NAD(P)-dependent oxidoreductase [Streptomyces sp. NPDC001220]
MGCIVRVRLHPESHVHGAGDRPDRVCSCARCHRPPDPRAGQDPRGAWRVPRVRPAVHQEPGCKLCALHADGKDVFIVEHWLTSEHFQAHLASSNLQRIRDATKPPLTEPPVQALADLPDLLPRADAVNLATPLTDATIHLVDAAFLARMRNGSLLVNIARGRVVDTEALLVEPKAGRLRAALDVTGPEPLPRATRYVMLRRCPGVHFERFVRPAARRTRTANGCGRAASPRRTRPLLQRHTYARSPTRPADLDVHLAVLAWPSQPGHSEVQPKVEQVGAFHPAALLAQGEEATACQAGRFGLMVLLTISSRLPSRSVTFAA